MSVVKVDTQAVAKKYIPHINSTLKTFNNFFMRHIRHALIWEHCFSLQGVMGCSWCTTNGTSGDPLDMDPFCSSQSQCFGGVLGRATPPHPAFRSGGGGASASMGGGDDNLGIRSQHQLLPGVVTIAIFVLVSSCVISFNTHFFLRNFQFNAYIRYFFSTGFNTVGKDRFSVLFGA